MDVTTTVLDPTDAAEQLEQYRTIKTPDEEERAIIAALVAAVAGKPLVNLTEALVSGGEFEDGCPRLAAMVPSQAWCYVRRNRNGTVRYLGLPNTRAASLTVTATGFPEMDYQALNRADLDSNWHSRRTQVPIVPPQHRVRGWKTRCLILWEVEEWARHRNPRPPGDPMLLRHVIDDLYSVEAVWDLTPLEQMVLGARA